MVLQLACELHEDLLAADGIAQLLNHLLDLVVELRLRPNYVEPVDQLAHHLPRVVPVLGGHHAHEEHDALDESGVLEVQVDDEALEHVCVLLDQVLRELLEQFRVPLNDSLLFLAALPLHLIVLLLEPVENILELVFVC